jgi:hypothetical protein
MAIKSQVRWLIDLILGASLIGVCAVVFSPRCNGLWSKLMACFDL